MAPTDCTLYAVLDNPEGPVVSRIPVRIAEEATAASFSSPIKAEGVHDLYLIAGGQVKLYSWIVK